MVTPRWCGASVCAATSSPRSCGSRWRALERHAGGSAPQKRGGKSINIPAQIGRKPLHHAEPAFAVLALEPTHRHVCDRPTEPMRFHQELDAVAEALIGLDRDAVDDAPREQAKSVAGIRGRQAREVMEREIAGTNQHRLE